MKMRWMLVIAVGLLTGGAVALVHADDWPQWRGPQRDNLSKEKGLLKEWPKGGPKLLWTYKNAGLGFSGFAVLGDVLYTMGARGETGKEQEYVMALDVKDPQKIKELWATPIGPIFTFPAGNTSNRWGDGPRATPTVDGDSIYALGGLGELVCLKRDGGTIVWRKNLVKDFGGQIMVYSEDLTGPMGWGYCESPLIDGELLICCPGGPKGWMLALNKKDGTQQWRSAELGQATDSSVVIATIDGVRQYVNSTFKGADGGGGVAGIDARDGKVLWYFPNPKYNVYAVCPTPVVKDNLVYVTAGYSAGCNLLSITKDTAGKFSVKDTYAFKAKNLMKSETGGVVLVDGFIYGNSEKLGWVCQEFQSGKEMWTDRNNPDRLEGFGGSLTYADGRLYLLSDDGVACLLVPTAEKWDEKGRFKLPALSESRPGGKHERPSHQSIRVWTHPVVANGRLYLRDQELIYCYAVR
jgi:outer membrane protein assembly factor BamB